MFNADQLRYVINGTPILDDVSFQVPAGRCLQICGANGSGKSTLLKALAGLIPLDHGEVIWRGESILSDLAGYHRQLTYLGHQHAVKDPLTVAEQAGNVTSELLAKLELDGLVSHTGAMLSRGQKQKVALAQRLSQSAGLWLLDEPLTALDQSSTQVVIELIAQQCLSGGIVVFSSHQPLQHDRVPLLSIKLEEGRVVESVSV